MGKQIYIASRKRAFTAVQTDGAQVGLVSLSLICSCLELVFVELLGSIIT